MASDPVLSRPVLIAWAKQQQRYCEAIDALLPNARMLRAVAQALQEDEPEDRRIVAAMLAEDAALVPRLREEEKRPKPSPEDVARMVEGTDGDAWGGRVAARRQGEAKWMNLPRHASKTGGRARA